MNTDNTYQHCLRVIGHEKQLSVLCKLAKKRLGSSPQTTTNVALLQNSCKLFFRNDVVTNYAERGADTMFKMSL